jgi:hypothetical protein
MHHNDLLRMCIIHPKDILLVYRAEILCKGPARNAKTTTYMFSLCPSSPPSNPGKGPPFSNWSKHKPVLRTTPSKAMGCKVFSTMDAGFLRHGRDLFLGNI